MIPQTVSSASNDLDASFRITQLLPLLLIALSLGALVLAGAPSGSPSLGKLEARLSDGAVAPVVAITVGSLLVSLILRPFQVQIVRFLEGYWGSGPIRDRFARSMRSSQLAERERLATRVKFADGDAKAQTEYRLRWFPNHSRFMPTRLGNVLRSTEDRAGQRYGFDTTTVWPRLYPLLSDTLRTEANKARDEYDTAARLCAVLTLAVPASGALLVANGGWWRTVPLVCAVLAYGSYRSACSAARYYGTMVHTAFDLHRYDLLDRLAVKIEPDRTRQFSQNGELSDFLASRTDRARFPFDFTPGVRSEAQ